MNDESQIAHRSQENVAEAKLRPGHIAGFDGLRTASILGVMAFHAGVPGLKGGWIGVDLFFAISGFLITTLLLREFDCYDRIDLGQFWMRRTLRLMPIYWLYIGGATLALWLGPPDSRAVHGGWTPADFTASLWLYFVNLLPMGGIWTGQWSTIHLWSLSVEEQYYAIWPLLLVAMVRSPRLLERAAWLVAAASTAYFVLGANDHMRSSMIQARGMPLFFASAIAVTLHNDLNRVRSWLTALLHKPIVSPAVCCVAFIALALGIFLPEPIERLIVLPVLAPLFGILVGSVAVRTGSRAGPWRPLLEPPRWAVAIGRMSYGIYLYHEVVRVVVWQASEGMVEGWPRSLAYACRLTIYFAASVGVAWISYRLVETPFLQLKSIFRNPRGGSGETSPSPPTTSAEAHEAR